MSVSVMFGDYYLYIFISSLYSGNRIVNRTRETRVRVCIRGVWITFRVMLRLGVALRGQREWGNKYDSLAKGLRHVCSVRDAFLRFIFIFNLIWIIYLIKIFFRDICIHKTYFKSQFFKNSNKGCTSTFFFQRSYFLNNSHFFKILSSRDYAARWWNDRCNYYVKCNYYWKKMADEIHKFLILYSNRLLILSVRVIKEIVFLDIHLYIHINNLIEILIRKQ